jgi:arylsulfatase A-like enzyme
MIVTQLNGFSLFLFIIGLAAIAYANEPNRPNIILVMADDQGWGETGYHGHPQLKTPVLDEMAQTGLRLERLYSAHVNCSPTRTSILTGRHPIRSGVFGPNWSTRPEEITVAQILKKAGYRTGHFGKWHVGAVKSASPTNPNKLGFDEYLSHDNFFELNPMLSRNGADPTTVQGESSQVVVDAAIEFIQQSSQKNQPFFSLIWFGSPHAPYSGLAEDVAKYASIENEALKNRLTEISAMDRSIGQLRKSLRSLKISDNTIVWFCSDNGMGHDPKSSFNGPWRDKKGSIFEGGVRVPGIIEWPNVIKSPRTSIVPCVTTDMFPTILDLLDLGHMLPKRPMDGISIKKLIVGADFAERPTPIGFWKYDSSGEQNNERWMPKELTRGTTPTVNNPAIDFLNFRHPVERKELEGDAAWTGNQYKLVLRGKKKERKAELYDLLADPGERVDIADNHPDVCKRMQDELVAWQRSVERSLTGVDYR